MKFTYYIIENYLSNEQIKVINEIIDNKGRSFYSPSGNDKIKTSLCHQIDYQLIEHIKDLKATINWINREAFGVDIYSQLNTDQFIRNIYADINEGEYNWHFDADPHSYNYTIKLTTLINLSNENYEGGELEIKIGNKPKAMKKDQGRLVAFPSYVLHQVKPITKGERNSLVVWITGPQFK